MPVTSEGSVRVDLVGGTLDLEPINLILPHAFTFNVATGLKAKVQIEQTEEDGIRILSQDYGREYFFSQAELTEENIIYQQKFSEMSFVLQITHLFELKSNLKITLSSGAPAGSGLGGSSAMGVTLYRALCDFKGVPLDIDSTIRQVKGVEGRILNQGIPGYQDYYPALAGGVLKLWGRPGQICFQQLYTSELKEFLENHLTLVYSGITRNSGINNWDVYKGFFDGNRTIRDGLAEIAELSFQFDHFIKSRNYPELLPLIAAEGEARKKLAPGIVPQAVVDFQKQLREQSLSCGLKMCGAGGGGCFILTHSHDQSAHVTEAVEQFGFQVLDFAIEAPYV